MAFHFVYQGLQDLLFSNPVMAFLRAPQGEVSGSWFAPQTSLPLILKITKDHRYDMVTSDQTFSSLTCIQGQLTLCYTAVLSIWYGDIFFT